MQDFIKKIDALASAYKKLPTEIATIAVNFSKERFREQNWWDTSEIKWKERKRNRNGSKKKSQTLLVGTGRLKRSIRKISANESQIIIGSDVPYAQIHNDGGTIKGTVTVKAHKRKIISNETVGTGVFNIRSRRERTKRIRVQFGEANVKSHTRKMNVSIPARPFIGQSAELEKRILNHIQTTFEKALNS
jgi:phage gpG-like protein